MISYFPFKHNNWWHWFSFFLINVFLKGKFMLLFSEVRKKEEEKKKMLFCEISCMNAHITIYFRDSFYHFVCVCVCLFSYVVVEIYSNFCDINNTLLNDPERPIRYEVYKQLWQGREKGCGLRIMWEIFHMWCIL